MSAKKEKRYVVKLDKSVMKKFSNFEVCGFLRLSYLYYSIIYALLISVK